MTAAAIVVEGLVKRYRGADRNAVDGVSFTVDRGAFFTLLGPNGAGKTTTLNILTTILAPTAGTACVAGHDVRAAQNDVRRRIGIIFQTPSLDQNLTAEENIRLHAVLYGVVPYRPTYRSMPKEYRDRVTELAGMLGIATDIFKQVRTFSGGMKRKLEILRSLMHKPAVLFLDEPTAGLDVMSRRTLWQYLREVRERSGTTLLLTTHYLEEAEDADAVCIIDQGRIVAQGSPAELKGTAGNALKLEDAYLRILAETE
ncbi:MAG: ATP-binding cassette domain-containing protein [Chloroflexi bacterium]|nr:ATP-binding cassette domain-containing protein [Chloroflexota bacterium]